MNDKVNNCCKIVSAFILFPAIIHAQTITTFAGTTGRAGYSGDGSIAVSATLNEPFGITTDKNGNVYITDSRNHVVRMVDRTGIISTIAGNGTYGYSGDGGPAKAAQLKFPSSPVTDAKGNIYFIDGDGNHVVRKVDATGKISTVAGTGKFGYSGDGGRAVDAELSNITDISMDIHGNLFIADYHNGRLRKVDANGIIHTVAGNGVLGFSGDGGAATNASINPTGITVDRNGNIYIADAGDARIRKIDPSGVITTIAGNGRHEYSGDNGPAIAAEVGSPYDIEVDEKGNIYFTDHDFHVVRKIDAAGIITTIAGNGQKGYTGDNGPPQLASLTFPVRMTIDHENNIYVADVINHTIRKISICKEELSSSITLLSSPEPVCEGDTIVFTTSTVNEGNNPGYLWYKNNQVLNNTTASFTTKDVADGDQFYRVLKSSLSCTSPSKSNTVVIKIHPKPQIELGADQIIQPGEQLQLKTMYSGNISNFIWTPERWLSNAFIPNPVAKPEKTTTYKLTAISDKGCKVSDSIRITVFAKLYMPNAFTPNKDSRNDVYRIPANTTLNLKRFSIFNRWGEMVFTTPKIEEGWNGKYKNAEAPAGVYVYIIEGSDPYGIKQEKGSFVLIR